MNRFYYSKDGSRAFYRDNLGVDHRRDGVTFAEAEARGARDFTRGSHRNAFDLLTPRHREAWDKGHREAAWAAGTPA